MVMRAGSELPLSCGEPVSTLCGPDPVTVTRTNTVRARSGARPVCLAVWLTRLGHPVGVKGVNRKTHNGTERTAKRLRSPVAIVSRFSPHKLLVKRQRSSGFGEEILVKDLYQTNTTLSDVCVAVASTTINHRDHHHYYDYYY